MVPLRQHLGADKNARAAAIDVGKILLKRAFAAGGIPVDTGNRDSGKQRSQRLLKLFGPQTYRYQMR